MVEQAVQRKYAELVLKMGVNLQKNQPLFVNAPVEGAEFVRILADEAYALGAKEVYINWEDDELTRLKYTHAHESVLTHYPEWKVKMQETYAEYGAAFVSIHATDPDLLNEVDPARIAKASKAAGIALKNFREQLMNDRITWTVISIPTAAWAQKIFPNASKEEAVARLWEEILRIVRVGDGDALKAWEEHNKTLERAHKFLNDKQYVALHFRAPGTDLEVGLPQNHIWQGGTATSQDGIVFNPNIPTEEVYTAPDAHRVNGTVTSTMPLNHGGAIIDEFKLTFKDGKVVDFSAIQGEEVLKNLLETDAGAKRLGEVALVPHESPVSQSGLIFFNTLFDENASCHLAFGKAYPTSIAGGPEMDEKELAEHGINDSMVHVDFMIGSDELAIDGVLEDGTKEPIFRNGTWAISLD